MATITCRSLSLTAWHREAGPLMLFDTHCHVNDGAYAEDRPAVFDRAAAAGVGLMICPATDMETSAQCLAMAKEHDGLYAAVGIHPEEAAKAKDGDLDQLRQWLTEEKEVVAVGEVGLDYHWPELSREIQKKVFIDQVKLAVELDVPIIIHDREAHGDTLDILRQYGKGIRGVFHCYSGSLEMTDELLRMGFYFGFDGPLTYPNSKRAKRVASHLPLERMLIETDCPLPDAAGPPRPAQRTGLRPLRRRRTSSPARPRR